MLTIVDTPIGAPVVPPAREARFDPALAAAFLPGAETTVARLSEPGALAVTTGQQPGLFGGPLYTLHKALSAKALAADLERRWGRPVVPIFWLAGDDHDYAEGASAAWFAADGSLITGALDPRPADAPMAPLSREPVPDRAIELLAQLVGALPESPAREETIAWLARHYRAGNTLAGAFGGAMAELLGPLGIACFDATSVAAKRAARPVLQESLHRAADLDRVLSEAAAGLDAAGQGVAVKVGDGATLAFLDGVGGRDRLVAVSGGFETRRGGERLTLAEVDRLLASEPERFSANVLLRPVVESAILPTVAYVAGPGELRYLRLAAALYEPLGVERQCPVPRWSGLLVEPRVSRTLEKFDLPINALLTDLAPLENRILRSMAPDDFEPAFAALRAALAGGYGRITEVALAIDSTLERPARSAEAAALDQVANLEKRLLGAQKRRQSELLGQLHRARTALCPAEAPQERVVGIPAFAGRYGFQFIADLDRHVSAWYAGALEAAPQPA